MKTLPLTESITHSGRLCDFINARMSAINGQSPNAAEQFEGFAKEFYLLVSLFVNTAANQISLRSCLTFPHLDLEHIDLFAFLKWSLLYNQWTTDLFAFERNALATARFTWE